jgi:hypothetical protein
VANRKPKIQPSRLYSDTDLQQELGATPEFLAGERAAGRLRHVIANGEPVHRGLGVIAWLNKRQTNHAPSTLHQEPHAVPSIFSLKPNRDDLLKQVQPLFDPKRRTQPAQPSAFFRQSGQPAGPVSSTTPRPELSADQHAQNMLDLFHKSKPGPDGDEGSHLRRVHDVYQDGLSSASLQGTLDDTRNSLHRQAVSRDITQSGVGTGPGQYAAPGRVTSGGVASIEGGGGFWKRPPEGTTRLFQRGQGNPALAILRRPSMSNEEAMARLNQGETQPLEERQARQRLYDHQRAEGFRNSNLEAYGTETPAAGQMAGETKPEFFQRSRAIRESRMNPNILGRRRENQVNALTDRMAGARISNVEADTYATAADADTRGRAVGVQGRDVELRGQIGLQNAATRGREVDNDLTLGTQRLTNERQRISDDFSLGTREQDREDRYFEPRSGLMNAQGDSLRVNAEAARQAAMRSLPTSSIDPYDKAELDGIAGELGRLNGLKREDLINPESGEFDQAMVQRVTQQRDQLTRRQSEIIGRARERAAGQLGRSTGSGLYSDSGTMGFDRGGNAPASTTQPASRFSPKLGREISDDEIDAAAQRRGISRDQVISLLGIQ